MKRLVLVLAALAVVAAPAPASAAACKSRGNAKVYARDAIDCGRAYAVVRGFFMADERVAFKSGTTNWYVGGWHCVVTVRINHSRSAEHLVARARWRCRGGWRGSFRYRDGPYA